jgi:pimeloyl-ACP methyl ester carboxylesterase
MDLDITEVGDGEALVVFVHGVLGRGSSFDRVADLLTSRCRMRWYDRRGYGRSRDANGPCGIETHVTDLLALLDDRPAVVVGHSFGGVTAMGAAVRGRGAVDALVLYETSMAWVPGFDDRIMEGVLSADDPDVAGLRMMLGDRYDAMSDDDRAGRRLDGKAFIAEERSVRGGAPPFDVAEIRAPIVYGRSDPRVMPEVIDHLQQHVEHVEVVTLAGAGHHAHRTAPEAFAQLVRRGLDLAHG